MSTGKTIRLLKAVKNYRPELSQKQIRECIALKSVLVNGKVAKENDWVHPDDVITLAGEQRSALEPNPTIDCKTLKKTRDFIFLAKGIGVHSVAHDFEESNSVANWLLSVDENLSELNPLECGLVHRLDFDTSGVIVAARNRKALEQVQKCFHQRTVLKEYVCLVANPPPPPGIYEALADKHPKSDKKIWLGEQDAKNKKARDVVTEILSVEMENNFYRLRIRLITGYRHQIRAHLKFLGCPIVGDKIYGGIDAQRLMLHAKRLEFEISDGKVVGAESVAPF